MGVFALFRRKSKDAAEVSAEKEQTDAPAAEAVEEVAVAEEPETAGSGSVTAEEATSDAAAAESAADVPAATTEEQKDAEPAATDALEIPKQQSADVAADNQVGETAHK
ncbi:hypothetical protein ACFYVL_18350 [Streptomyces sp. NPDC004111]|uniref:hypothetical protein n=1 Tax=Streptomyces sp. NPDC004111 TaxID=3364690 RepID=UPI0036CABAB3